MRNIIGSGGMRLQDFLNDPKMVEKIKNKRIFYIVEPRLEQGKYLKFGIAGVNTGRGIARLKEYDIVYGHFDTGNKCTGVTLWAVYPFEYNRLVEPKNSKVAKLELKLKRQCRGGFSGSDGKEAKCREEDTGDFRGSERVSGISGFDLIKKVNSLLGSKELDDDETNIDRDARESTKKYRKDKKAFKDNKGGQGTDEESAGEAEEEATENARDLRTKSREERKKKQSSTPKTQSKKAPSKKEKPRTIETRSVTADRVRTRSSAK